MKVSLRPDLILCGWLGIKHRPATYLTTLNEMQKNCKHKTPWPIPLGEPSLSGRCTHTGDVQACAQLQQCKWYRALNCNSRTKGTPSMIQLTHFSYKINRHFKITQREWSCIGHFSFLCPKHFLKYSEIIWIHASQSKNMLFFLQKAKWQFFGSI